MKKLIKKLFTPVKNQRGNVVVSAFITMIVLSMSVAGVAQLTINQYKASSVKVEQVNGDLLGEALLEQAVYEFETYLRNNNYDFSLYMTNMTSSGYTAYGILVEDVSGTVDVNGDYTNFDGTQNFVYRFTYTDPDLNEMVMYSYITNTGTYTDQLNPFDFSLATNGNLIINSGYLRNPSMYGDTILFGNASPFINRVTGLPDLTTAPVGPEDEFPQFNGNSQNQANVYYSSGFNYCEPYCYGLGATANDPFELQTSEFLNIFDSGINTGAVNADKVISDFFGNFSLATQIVDYVQNDGPTGTQTVSDSMSLSTLWTVIYGSNSGDPEPVCQQVKIKGKWTEVCYDGPSSQPYTRLNTYSGFDPANSATTLDFAGVYDGNLTINNDFTMSNLSTTSDTETMIVNGDVTFDNTSPITLDGFIVVLGDLHFTGNNVAIGGGFYVTGQTYIDFDPNCGFDDPGNQSAYSFSLQTMDNIFIESLYESHVKADSANVFNWMIYTEESIYADAVNSRLYVNGVFFAAARGNSGNDIPMVDELGDPVRGIVINAFNGYIDSSGNPVMPNNFTTFDFDILNENNLQSEFIQLPTFDTLLISEGVYSFERSAIYYN